MPRVPFGLLMLLKSVLSGLITRDEALAAESDAIKREKPEYNVMSQFI